MGNSRQIWGFPGGSDGKESPMQETWVRPLRRQCNPLQYCLENSMGSPSDPKEWDTIKQLVTACGLPGHSTGKRSQGRAQ